MLEDIWLGSPRILVNVQIPCGCKIHRSGVHLWSIVLCSCLPLSSIIYICLLDNVTDCVRRINHPVHNWSVLQDHYTVQMAAASHESVRCQVRCNNYCIYLKTHGVLCHTKNTRICKGLLLSVQYRDIYLPNVIAYLPRHIAGPLPIPLHLPSPHSFSHWCPLRKC